jgi:hypothetical protein
MPMINGRYYMNPGYGRALERARLAEAFTGSRPAGASDEDESWIDHAINYFTQPQRVSPDPDPPQGGGSRGAKGPDDTSWWDELINSARPKPVPPPPTPKAPGVNQDALERSVDQSRNRALTNHDVGLIVFQETKSFSGRPDSNRPIDVAREELAHAVINGDRRLGYARPITAGAIEPSEQELRNPAIRAAYESSMGAARRAYLSRTDPTNGAEHLNSRGDPGLYNWKAKGMTGPGNPIKTHSGPYNNSYTKGDAPHSAVWLNTYERD